jgi:hypothetical protein
VGALRLPHPNRQNFVGTQMYCWRQRRALPHGAIAKEFHVAIDPKRGGWKQKRNGTGSHQVLDGDIL